MHQVILNILITKDLGNKIFDHIDLLGETLSSISWPIRYHYHCIIMATPGNAIFGIDMIFNLTSVVYWRVVTASRQQQLDIDDVR